MKNKITLLALTMLFILALSFDAVTSSSGSPSARSGSPASFGTCAASGCHNGPAVTTESIIISTDIPASGFEENKDYTISITMDDGGRNLSRMGFQTSIESAAGAEGTLTAAGSDIKTVGFDNYVTHTSAGIAVSGGSRSWSFTWNSGSAPDQTTIYTAGNFANGNSTASGDVITTAQLTLNKAANISITDFDADPIGVYPNPASGFIQFKGLGHIKGDIKLYNLKGQMIKVIAREEVSAGISIGDLTEGVYILTDEAGHTDYLQVSRKD